VRDVSLSAGERQVVHYLAEFGTGTFLQLGQLFWHYERVPLGRVRSRLDRLVDRHILTQQVGEVLGRYGLPIQMIYRLGPWGRSLRADETLRLGDIQHPDGEKDVIRQVLIGEVGMRWQEALAARGSADHLVYYGGYRAITPTAGEAAQMPHPAALMVLWGADWVRYFFVDLDLGACPLDAYREKHRRYARYRDAGQWRPRYPAFPELLVVGWAAAPQGADQDARSNRAHDRIAKIAALVGSQDPDLPWRFATLDQINRDATPLDAERTKG
jgi:hypothetical protein